MHNKKNQVRISVRNLVEFLLRSGDIDNRKSGGLQLAAMQEGTRIHRKLQKRMGATYQSEVPLSFIREYPRFELVIEGRADGIFEKDAMVFIDEIKGIYRDVEEMTEPVSVHLAQAKCYAYFYGLDLGLDCIGVQMTYCDLDTENVKRMESVYSMEELGQWMEQLLLEYEKWANFQFEWKEQMQNSCQALQFPYEYRDGQKQLVEDTYRTMLRKKILFIQAPTGSGKTLATLYPAVKAVGEELAEKIFYLTAKTITASVAMDTFSLFAQGGYCGKVLQITAKEKLCKCQEMDCNPQSCPYAKGHYDRVNDAVFDLLTKKDVFSREVLLEQADSFTVCPFEMCLDLSLWCDAIICDYNYVFDPNVYLKRFFADGNKGSYLFLVDEAHNLVDRGRNMYSKSIYKEHVMETKRLVKNHSKKLERGLERVNKIMLEYKRQCEDYVVLESISDLVFACMSLAAEMEKFLQMPLTFLGEDERKRVLDFYFELRNFLAMYEVVDEKYVIYSKQDEEGFFIKLFCVDPSGNIQNCLEKSRSTIFFSGTLLPIDYYKSLLSTKEDNYAIYAKTIFQKEQRMLALATDVSSKYTRRTEKEFEKIAEYIRHVAESKVGNYMVFFPSYRLMEQVYDSFLPKANAVDVMMQRTSMTEAEREEFLMEFEKERERSFVAFCVLGGIFSEGIDLTGQKLIGTLIVGTGLPQINHEGELLKNYYDKKQGNGFDYAYRIPGMNKVQQAAGRVIRTISDEGVIVLLDERFLEWENLSLFPREWQDYQTCQLSKIQELLREFWSRK